MGQGCAQQAVNSPAAQLKTLACYLNFHHEENEGAKMASFLECINEYKKQLKKGAIQEAYVGVT